MCMHMALHGVQHMLTDNEYICHPLQLLSCSNKNACCWPARTILWNPAQRDLRLLGLPYDLVKTQ